MKMKKFTCLGTSIAMLCLFADLRGEDPANEEEMTNQIRAVIDGVQSQSLPTEKAAEILKNITEKAPQLAETPLFEEALLVCYSANLSDDKLKCYEDLSQGKLCEPLFCAIQDNFDEYDSFANKDLRTFLLGDVRVPEEYSYLNDNFHSDYEYWTHSIIAWILKQRIQKGDETATEALEEAIADLKIMLRDFDYVPQATKKLLPLLEEDDPFIESSLFQEALKITFPHISET